MIPVVKWFGESWGAPICDPDDRADVPAGQSCRRCERSILDDDRGLLVWSLEDDRGSAYRPWHLACFLDSVIPRTTRRETDD